MSKIMNLRIDIPCDDEISKYPKPISMLKISELHKDNSFGYIKNLTWNDIKIKNKNLCNIIIERIINKICDTLNK